MRLPSLRLPAFLAALWASLAIWPGFAHAGDPRLVTRLFDPDAVVRIDGRANVQAAIAFADGETIENVAIGDANAWQVTPNRRASMLFVKPLAATARTNLTVVTNARTYFFDLVSSPNARPLYVLRFTYPDAPGAVDAAPAKATALTEEERGLVEGEPAAVPRDPATLNFAWARKGKSRLWPSRVFDDGTAVYLAWAPGFPVPAILVRDASGREGPVNYSVRGDTIVVEGVPGVLLLRSGKDMARLESTGSRPQTAVVPPELSAAREDR